MQTTIDPVTGQVSAVDPNATSTTGAPAAGAQPGTTTDPATAPPVDGTTSGSTPAGPGGTAVDPNADSSTDPTDPDAPTNPGGTAQNGGPVTANDPDAVVPASQLPSWEQWEAQFAALGLAQSDIDTIGGEYLTDRQLAEVYLAIEQSAGPDGQVPTDPTSPTDPTTRTDPTKPTSASAWTPEWEAKFRELGLGDDEISQLAEAAQQKGLTDEQIQATYDSVASSLPGWNAEWQKKFEDLGMPKEMIEMYAQSGAPEGGLQAIYDDAKKRWEAFGKRERDHGAFFGLIGGGSKWTDELKAHGLKDGDLWTIALADTPYSDDKLEAMLNAQKKADKSMKVRTVQNVASFLPGVDLAQYIVGKKFVTGESIDNGDLGNIGWAALSGLAAFAAIRGGMSISSGLKVAKTGGEVLAGSEGLQQGVLGSLHNGGLFTKLKSFVPFTKEQQTAVALHHFDRAMGAYQGGGKAAMEAAGLGDDVSKVDAIIEGVRSGSIKLGSGKNAYIGKLNRFPLFTKLHSAIEDPVKLVAGKDGSEVLTFGKSLPYKRGSMELAAHLAGVRELANGVKTGEAQETAKALASVGRATQAFDGAGLLKDRNAVGKLIGTMLPGVQEKARLSVPSANSALAHLAPDAVATTETVAPQVAAESAEQEAAALEDYLATNPFTEEQWQERQALEEYLASLRNR
jgi:hypothetical protein